MVELVDLVSPTLEEWERSAGGPTRSPCPSRHPAKVLLIAGGRSLSDIPSTTVPAATVPATKILAAMALEGIESHLVSSPDEIGELLQRYPHWIAVCDIEGLHQPELEMLGALRRAGSVPTLILAPPQDLDELFLGQRPSPGQECAAKPIEADELICRVKALMLRSGYRATSASEADRGGQAPVPDRAGKLVTVYHAKGGVGTSTIAANLAVGLGRTTEARVLLVDADVWYGDLAALLDMPPSDNMLRVVDAWTGKAFDKSVLDRVPSKHGSGLCVLMRPEEPSTVERLDSNLVAAAISAYRTLFDFVIVDTAPSLNEFNLQILDASDQIILVSSADVSSLYNTRRFLDVAERVGYAAKASLVLNRADTGITTELAEANMKMSASVLLPSAGRLVVDAANRGAPVLMEEHLQDHAFSRNLRRLVDLVAGRLEPEIESPSKPVNLFSRMRGGFGFAAQRMAG